VRVGLSLSVNPDRLSELLDTLVLVFRENKPFLQGVKRLSRSIGLVAVMSGKFALLALAGAANAASLTDIKHVVMLMMENRAFNHVSIPWLLFSLVQL
jgi:hypothetical protein